ncbi:MAG: isochorismatase family protein [Spirochaetales bacterium]|nr:isochorismatase family protein [Spirochaetales bacterium]
MVRELLIIDAQNDFCEPDGALYVQGAEEDCRRLADFIGSRGDEIDSISLTLDSHHLYDIAHPLYWVDGDGNHPAPFTFISAGDVESGLWTTSRPEEKGWGLEYVRTLEERGKYTLCVWPPHCLIGSWGNQIQSHVFQALTEWEKRKLASSFKIVKGDDSRTEHYGAFEPEVSGRDAIRPLKIDALLERLQRADEIYIAGEALDYCVANTVRQLADALPPGQAGKIILLEDCCSSVDPASGLSRTFLEDMKARGMRLQKSTDK